MEVLQRDSFANTNLPEKTMNNKSDRVIKREQLTDVRRALMGKSDEVIERERLANIRRNYEEYKNPPPMPMSFADVDRTYEAERGL